MNTVTRVVHRPRPLAPGGAIASDWPKAIHVPIPDQSRNPIRAVEQRTFRAISNVIAICKA